MNVKQIEGWLLPGGSFIGSLVVRKPAQAEDAKLGPQSLLAFSLASNY